VHYVPTDKINALFAFAFDITTTETKTGLHLNLNTWFISYKICILQKQHHWKFRSSLAPWTI